MLIILILNVIPYLVSQNTLADSPCNFSCLLPRPNFWKARPVSPLTSEWQTDELCNCSLFFSLLWAHYSLSDAMENNIFMLIKCFEYFNFTITYLKASVWPFLKYVIISNPLAMPAQKLYLLFPLYWDYQCLIIMIAHFKKQQ